MQTKYRAITITQEQRVKLTLWLNENKEELQKYSNLVIAEKAKEALQFNLSFKTIEGLRKHLFPRHKSEKVRQNGGVLLARIVELEKRVQALEQQLKPANIFETL